MPMHTLNSCVLVLCQTFGTLRSVVSAHHFCANNDFKDSNVRYKKELEPLGALGDLGW